MNTRPLEKTASSALHSVRTVGMALRAVRMPARSEDEGQCLRRLIFFVLPLCLALANPPAFAQQPSATPLPPLHSGSVELPQLPPPLPLAPEQQPGKESRERGPTATPGAPETPANRPEPVPPRREQPPPQAPLPKLPRPSKGVSQLRLVLIGNTHFTADQVRTAISEQIETAKQSGLTRALADDIAFFLGIFYHKHGYSQATVQTAIVSSATVRLRIHEGPLTELGALTFHGNRRISDAVLRGYLTGATEAKPSGEHKVIPYVQSEINAGVDRIRGFYRSEGFLDAVVEDPVVDISPDKTRADVSLQIKEGTQYRFGSLTFEGDIVFFPQRQLLKELKVYTSAPYTPEAVTNLERKVVYFYRSRGYYNAKVHSESDPAKAQNGRVPVKLIVEAGDIYRFDGVTQSGLRKLRPSVLKNRFRSLRGQVYNPAKLEERYRSLMGTGLFANLKLTQTPQPNHEVALHFDVEEAKSRELGFSIGYGSLEGAIFGTRYTDRDLFGYGRSLSADAEVAERLLRGEFVYTDPWFLESDFTLRLRVYELSQDLFDYTKVETGLRLELSRKITQHLELAAFLLTRKVDIDNTAGIEAADLGLKHYYADSLGASLTLDYRDSVLNPTKGLIINATTDVAWRVFGSDLNFLRGTFRMSYYLPVGKTLLSFGARGGVIYAISNESDIPIDERFFNGGSRSVRSYIERSLGPHDNLGHAVGGESFTNANIEDVFPLFGQLKGAVFFDFGSVGRRLSNGFGETGYAVGPGLRYQLPVGPIRLDYGFNPFRRANQPFGALQLSFGFAF